MYTSILTVGDTIWFKLRKFSHRVNLIYIFHFLKTLIPCCSATIGPGNLCPKLRQFGLYRSGTGNWQTLKSVIWNVSWHCRFLFHPSSVSLCSACWSVSVVLLMIHTGQSKTPSVVVNQQTSFIFSKQLMNWSLRLSLWSGRRMPEPCEVVKGYLLLLNHPSFMYWFCSPFYGLFEVSTFQIGIFVLILWNLWITETSQQLDCRDSELKQYLIFSLIKF